MHVNNMDESWKHYVKWKKPVKKNHILYGYIYGDTSGCQELREGGHVEWLLTVMGFFWGAENVQKLMVMVV